MQDRGSHWPVGDTDTSCGCLLALCGGAGDGIRSEAGGPPREGTPEDPGTSSRFYPSHWGASLALPSCPLSPWAGRRLSASAPARNITATVPPRCRRWGEAVPPAGWRTGAGGSRSCHQLVLAVLLGEYHLGQPRTAQGLGLLAVAASWAELDQALNLLPTKAHEGWKEGASQESFAPSP